MNRYKFVIMVALAIVFLTCISTVASAAEHDIKDLTITPSDYIGGSTTGSIQFNLDNDRLFGDDDQEDITIIVKGPSGSTTVLLDKKRYDIPVDGLHISYPLAPSSFGTGKYTIEVICYEKVLWWYDEQDKDSASINIDNTKPTITGAVTTSPNSNGWYKDPVTVRFTASDAHSGLSTPAIEDVVLSGDGADQSVTRTAVDRVGNSRSATVNGIDIDRTAPSISGAATTAPNGDGWYNGPVTIQFTASDALSGLASFAPESVTLSTDGAAVSATSYATDKAGNSNSATVTVKIDQVDPHTDVALSGTIGENDWYTTDVVMTLTHGDGLSGVRTTEYSTDGGENWDSYTGPVTFSNEGTTTVLYRSIDVAGNVEESHSVTFKVDLSDPAISGTPAPSPNVNGWNNGDVTVHFAASDSVSGINAATLTADQIVTTEGYMQPVTGTVKDNAGRTASTTVYVSIDKAVPATAYGLDGLNGDNSWFVGDVRVTLYPTDGGSSSTLAALADVSGIDKTMYQVDGDGWQEYGASFVVSGEGYHTVEFYSIDRAGNREGTKSIEVKIDTIAPASDVLLSGTMGNNDWYTSDVTMTLTAIDGGDSGIARIEYSTDSGVTWVTYVDPVVFSAEGQATVLYRAVDEAGNVEAARPLTFKIDKTKPVDTASLAGTRSSFGWFESDAKLTLVSNDAISGLSSLSYSLDGQTWSPYTGAVNVPLGLSRSLYYGSVDNAGNRNNGSISAYFPPKSFVNIYDWQIVRQIESILNGSTPTPTPTPTPGSEGTVTPTPTPTPTPTATPIPTATEQTQPDYPLIFILLALLVGAILSVYYVFLRHR